MIGKPTRAQARWLSYLSQPHTGGRCELTGMRDLEMGDQLVELGLARFYEMRPGFYSLHITDAGRAAIAKAVKPADAGRPVPPHGSGP